MKIDHVGYLVGDINKAINEFEELGYCKKNDIIRDELRKIDICFMDNNGYCVELVTPLCEESVVYSLYKKLREAPYHFCYEVECIEESISELKKKGYVQTQPIQEAVAFNGRRVVFLFNKSMGLIEIVEKEKNNGK